MELIIPRNKIYNQPQTLQLNSNVMTFVGENGCGKSAILESIFTKYLDDNQNNTRLISFSSGNNESFSEIFQNSIKSKQRFIVNNFDDEEKFENAINAFYFDESWVRFLIFFATALKRDGKVIEYLKSKELVDINDQGVDVTTKIGFPFRVRKAYNDKIIYAIKQEAEDLEYEARSIRNTFFHQLLTKLTEQIHSSEFDFEEENSRIIKSWKSFSAKDAAIVLGTDTNKIFSFLAWASLYDKFIFRNECGLYFKGDLELNQLSDGEHQLLAIYALFDLFDSENTLFLLDEVDSHLYYKNIKKLWGVFTSINGRVITTTHTADSILMNEFTNIKLVEKGKIEEKLTFIELSKRLDSVVGQKNYQFNILSRVKFPVLMDNINDWTIFKKLAAKKIGEEVNTILDQFLPIAKESSFNSPNEILGKSKLHFINEFRKINLGKEIITKHIFLICDKDVFPSNQIKDNLLVNIHNDFNELGEFNSERTHTHLLCWKRREIENYLLSPTLLNVKNYMNNVMALYNLPILNEGQNLDNVTDIKEGDFKVILRPLYNQEGIGFDEDMLGEAISHIPGNEISEDIIILYNYLKDTITE